MSSGGSSGGLKLNSKDRPWFKLGVVRAVPEWEALLKLSKHSPKVFSVVSKNELFGIKNEHCSLSVFSLSILNRKSSNHSGLRSSDFVLERFTWSPMYGRPIRHRNS